jgi:hypothetical protein
MWNVAVMDFHIVVRVNQDNSQGAELLGDI